MKKLIIGIAPQVDELHHEILLSEYFSMLDLFDCDYELLGFGVSTNALRKYDGFIIPGGDDINPALYGQTPLPTTQKPIQARDEFELMITNFCLAQNVPLLGICRGAQMINVACGGTLNQSIDNHWDVVHEITYSKQTFKVVSKHRQCIDALGNNCSPCALATDNIIEAIKVNNHTFIQGVQWHPELMPNSKLTNIIMNEFLTSCSK